MAGLLGLLFIGCNFQSDGGPCSYDTTIYPATLLQKIEINAKYYDLMLEVEMEGKKDTLSYAKKNNGSNIAYELIPADSLAIGSQYQYKVMRIKTGTCSPEVDIIELTPFVANR